MLLQLQIRDRYKKHLVVDATTDVAPITNNVHGYRGDYIGKRYGSLTVIAYPVNKKGIRRAGAYCRCDCGEMQTVSSIGELERGVIYQCKFCGRKAQSEAMKNRWRNNPNFKKRGKYTLRRKERLFHVWESMKSRCGKADGYKDVRVCDEWLDYEVFREWAYSHGYDDKAPRGKCTIDRINPFGNYEPSNCRFVDMQTQLHNKRATWMRLDEETRKAMVETIAANQ